MKKSRLTDRQIIDALKRVESGLAVPELCSELGISKATFYKWRPKYGGMDASLMARMKELRLNLRIKPRKRLVGQAPEPLTVPIGVNQVWSMDFMHDQLADGRMVLLLLHAVKNGGITTALGVRLVQTCPRQC